MEENIKQFLKSFDIRVSRISPSEFAETKRYMGTGETRWPGKYSFNLTPYLKEVLDCLRPEVPVTRIAVIKAAQIGFALSINTPIPTVNGWKKMKDIIKSDIIYDENGCLCNVISATDIMHNHECFKITFSDKTEIICDSDHLWTVKDRFNPRKIIDRTIDTKEIFETFTLNRKSNKYRYHIPISKPVFKTEKQLPIPPYFIGFWLGNGSRSGNDISVNNNDLIEVYNNILKEGLIVGKSKIKTGTNCSILNVKMNNGIIKNKMISLNIYRNKHIPEIYLQSSIEQRIELLKGIVDSDGSIDKIKSRVGITTVSKQLFDGYCELITSLGYKIFTSKTQRHKAVINGIQCNAKDIYKVTFYATKDIAPSGVSRKINCLKPHNEFKKKNQVNARTINNVEKVKTEPVKCIQVDSKSHLFLAGKQMVPTHNSTGVIENAIPWIISEYPSNILLMAADDELVRTAMSQKIDPAIDSCGIRPLIGAHTGKNKKRNQRTGDTEKSKEFPGGRLIATSVKNAHKMRQFSAKYGFLDDLDAGKQADEREGSLIKLVDGRFTTFGDTAKIFYISTPVTKQTSIIEPLFLKGDQRYYNVPCPHCGGYQSLKWSVNVDKSIVESGKAGIHFEREEKTGKLIIDSVCYICEHCGEPIDEKHKYEMNLNGKWVPTAEPSVPNFRSYHISGLYSPPGAYSWTQFAQDWCDIYPPENGGKPVIHLLKTFKNICLGQTYEERGRGIDVIQLATNTRNEYTIGIIPADLSVEDGNGKIVMITAGCDLNGTIDDARLDYIVVAWTEVGTSYCIDHGSIGSYQGRKSKKDDAREIMSYRNEARNSVWDRYFNDVLDREWVCDNGAKMKILVSAVDTGYHTVFAYEFMNKNDLILGVKGQEDNKFTAFDTDKPLFKQSAERDDLYILQSNKYKDQLAERIDLNWHDKEGPQPVGFMNFPQPSEGKFTIDFFNQYAGERRDYKFNDDGSAVGSRWVKKHSSSQNHFWDCDIYSRAARDIFVNTFCQHEGIKKPTWHTFVSIVMKK